MGAIETDTNKIIYYGKLKYLANVFVYIKLTELRQGLKFTIRTARHIDAGV